MSTTTTYLSNNAIRQEIDQLRPNHLGRNTSILGVWNAVLATQFPVQQNYITRPREHGWYNERDLWYDLQVLHVRNNTSNVILVVICRTAAGHANANEGVDQWQVHLELYLGTIFGKRRRAGRPPRVYGVIAHGLGATFFSYDVGDDIPMLIFRDHEADRKKVYHLVEDHQKIQGFLDVIRDSH
ncbi:uncharacterized protein N7496_008693 [Penicillium cataractarum]|uniref:Uncharacterized protein n=1 Tax=Penicillium cataractarum TaxID=2100454 RepID=A0A9W9V4T0_9EURO|nr:uncharacterized protein N7496_008693 [Penicillium cataractarum]KAJ5368933.1 hypothetical protein N7496_008693 [Penicillium cataractarum]